VVVRRPAQGPLVGPEAREESAVSVERDREVSAALAA
jgi:hypothetical protein